MKKLWFKTLLRSPVKTAVTFLLLLASAFLLTRNLTDWLSSRSAYQNALKNYEGVLTAEHPYQGKTMMNTPLFLLTEPGMPENPWHPQEQFHVPDLDAETIEALSALPYVERTEKRYLTAGVSDYERVYQPRALYAYTLRFVVEGTLASCEVVDPDSILAGYNNEGPSYRLYLSDAELLAGDSDVYSMCINADRLLQVSIGTSPDAERPYMPFVGAGGGLDRYGVFCLKYPLHEELDFQEGRRYVFVLRGDWLTFNHGAADLFMGDDSINGWWPYITDVTDEPENYLETEAYAPLRQLIQVTEDDRHTLDVVYCDDMNALRRVTTDRMFLRDGRFLTPDDAGKPVCVLSENQAAECGLGVGDTLTLELGSRLCEQYVGLGALAVTQGRYSTEFTDPQEFTVVGIYADVNQRDKSKEDLVNSTKWLDKDLHWGYADAAVFIPTSFLPESADLSDHGFKPGEVSFVIAPENIRAFQEECLPLVEEMGLDFEFSDGGWLLVGEPLKQAELLSMVKLLIFTAAALLASLLTTFLFIGHRKREYAVLRALGAESRLAGRSLLRPFLLLSACAVIPGSAGAAVSEKLNSGQWQIFGALLSIPALMLLLWAMAALSLHSLGKRPVLELMQLSAPVRTRRRREAEEAGPAAFGSGTAPTAGLDGLARKKHNGLTRRYLRRHILRSSWKSLLAILLAALLAFGMAELTALREKNRELVDTVETKAYVTGGLSCDRALQVLDSGMVRNHYFEQVKDCEMQETPAVCCLVSDLRRLSGGEITWLDGWDAEAFFKREKIILLPRPYLEAQGLKLGDTVLMNEPDCMATMLTNHEDWSLDDFYEWRGKNRPECTIVGVWETGSAEDVIYVPMDAEYFFRFEWSYTALDVADYTLTGYGEAEAFTDWMNDLLARVAQPVRLMLDTAEAERANRMCRLTELIYPAAFLLSLLLGTVLPGLIILQEAREASILRALGTTKQRTRTMLTLEQAILCLVGLLLSAAAVLAVHQTELQKLLRPLGSYYSGHLAACVIGCLLFSVSVTKKRVLELLQVKE